MTKEFELYRSVHYIALSEETQMGNVALHYWKYLVVIENQTVAYFFSRRKVISDLDLNRNHQIFGEIINTITGKRVAKMQNRNNNKVTQFVIEATTSGCHLRHITESNEEIDLGEFESQRVRIE